MIWIWIFDDIHLLYQSETSKNTNKLVLMWDCILYSVFIVLYNQGKKIFYKRIITFNWEVYFLSGTSLIFYINGKNVASTIILFFFLYFLVKLICTTINYVWARKESCLKLFCLHDEIPHKKKSLGFLQNVGYFNCGRKLKCTCKECIYFF